MSEDDTITIKRITLERVFFDDLVRAEILSRLRNSNDYRSNLRNVSTGLTYIALKDRLYDEIRTQMPEQYGNAGNHIVGRCPEAGAIIQKIFDETGKILDPIATNANALKQLAADIIQIPVEHIHITPV